MSRQKVLGLIVVAAVCVGLAGCFLFPNRPPTAAFVVHYNQVAGDPMRVVLDASVATDPDGDDITRFMWAFSDDLALIEPTDYSAVRETPVLHVRCPVAGTYTATLVVSDARGLTSDPAVGTIVVPQTAP